MFLICNLVTLDRIGTRKRYSSSEEHNTCSRPGKYIATSSFNTLLLENHLC